MSYMCPHCNSFPMEDNLGVSAGKKHTSWWCGKYDWRAPNRLLVVQTGESLVVRTGASVNQDKVFRAHAVPQGLCDNLINALKLLQTSKRVEPALFRVLLQTSVKGAGKVSRRV